MSNFEFNLSSGATLFSDKSGNISSIRPEGVKSFIIGKKWTLSKDGSQPGAIRLNRDLPESLKSRTIKASDLQFFPNEKRQGYNDADFTVSILLPIAEADAYIAEQKANRAVAKVA